MIKQPLKSKKADVDEFDAFLDDCGIEKAEKVIHKPVQLQETSDA